MKKVSIASLALLLVCCLFMSVVSASASPKVQQVVLQAQGSTTTDLDEVANYFGFSEQEKQDFVKLIKEEESPKYEVKGKLSWAVKALKAAWDLIPDSVKVALGGTAGFATLLSVIDNFTGAVEDAVYAGALAVTGNETVAWWITKALMLLL